MTVEEAIEVVANINVALSRRNGKTILCKALNTICQEVEKSEKYKWHDLRKNPDDLPLNDRCVLVMDVDGFITTASLYEDGVLWKDESPYQDEITFIENVIAWREIETFGEVNE